MNILIVSAQFPYPPRSGFSTRVYQLARQLATRHTVTLLSYALPRDHDGVAALAAEIPVRAVDYDKASLGAKRVAQALSMVSPRPYHCTEWHSDRMQQAIDDLCSSEKFDLIQLETSFLCTFRFPKAARLVIDEHNIEYEVFQRMGAGERSLPRRAFHRIEHARCRRFEQRWWERADACIVTSDREARIVRAHAPGTPVAVAPNGVDLAYFRPQPGEGDPGTIVFNGTLAYRPNTDAAQHLIDEIWPSVRRRRPDARLTIVGHASAADVRRMRRPGVELVGEVPDVRPYLRSAAVVVVPIRFGGGTRLKVVEALAMGRATVATSLGCEGLAVRDGEDLLIADDAESFAERVLELLDDPERRAAIGRSGRGLVEREYSWDLVGERLEALYARLAVAAPGGNRAASSPAPAVVRGHE